MLKGMSRRRPFCSQEVYLRALGMCWAARRGQMPIKACSWDGAWETGGKRKGARGLGGPHAVPQACYSMQAALAHEIFRSCPYGQSVRPCGMTRLLRARALACQRNHTPATTAYL